MRSSRLVTAVAVGAALVVAGPVASGAAATSVSGASLTLSSTSATATQVTYTVPFTATGGLTNGTTTITLAGPAGTVFPTAASCGGDYGVAVGTAAAANCGTTITAGGGTNSVTFHSPVDAPAGAAVTVTVNGVTNTSTTGPLSLQVSTSNDSTPVTVSSSLTAPTSLAAVTFHQTSTSANATQVTYTLSATLTNGLTAAFSTFTFAAPAGASFPSSGSCGGDYSVSVNGASAVFCSANVVSGAGTNTVTFNSSVSAKAGDKVVVTVNGVANPTSSGSKMINLSNSSDPVAVGEPMNVTAPTSISGLSVAGSTTSPAATAVTYSLSFTTTNGLTAGFSTISVTAPGGTVFSSSGSCGGDYAFSVNGAHPVTCSAVVVSGGGTNAVVFNSAVDAVAGDHITITITHVSNSSASGVQQITVSTSSDPGAVSAPLTLAGSSAPPVAVNDGYATAENTTLTVPAPGVLANDTAAGGHTLTAAVVTTAAHGTLALNADGSFTYTPATNFTGSDAFTYRDTDSTGGATSNDATVALTVDASPPTTTVPPPPPPVVVTPTPTVKFCYGATDPQSGIDSYDVRYREAVWNKTFKNFAYPPGWQHAKKTCESLVGKPGHEYCFSMRARNRAGLASGWSRQWCKTVPLDDRALTLVSGNWARGTGDHYYRNTISTTRSPGAKLRLAGAHVHRVALIVTECPGCGTFTVVIGRHRFTVNSNAGHTRNLVVVVLGAIHPTVAAVSIIAKGHGPVFIDGIAILQD